MSRLIVTTSWDDGQRVDLRLAELLSKYGIKGTFYVAGCFQDPLGKHDMAEIDKEHEIGAHTLTHVDLSNTPYSEAEREISGSKAYLEDSLGHSISMFCYPYGRYNEAIKRMVQDCGFTAARTSALGGFGLPQNPYQWHITLVASNGSPLTTLKTCRMFRLRQPSALLDWESRAKSLFDLALERGGVYHIYGHSWEIDEKKEWPKLTRVLSYISGRQGVLHLTNGQTLASFNSDHHDR